MITLSIVAIVIDNLEITKRFISSIRQYTSTNYELILIDNKSKDKETIEFIKEHFENPNEEKIKTLHRAAYHKRV